MLQKNSQGFVHFFLLFIIIISIALFFVIKNQKGSFSPLSPTPTPEPTQAEQIYKQERSDEFSSPDGKHIAYTEDSPETIARAKERDSQGYGFIEGSTNVWVENADRSNKIQITKHEDFVYREIIKWIDNDRLLFHDGESTLRIYSISQKKLTDLLDSQETDGYCVDSCYLLYENHGFSPDKTYYYNLYAGKNDDTIEVANIETLQTFTLNNPYNKCITDFTFPNDHTFTFKGSHNPPDEENCKMAVKVTVTVDLVKKKITSQ